MSKKKLTRNKELLDKARSKVKTKGRVKFVTFKDPNPSFGIKRKKK
jgi:hypothetical protein